MLSKMPTWLQFVFLALVWGSSFLFIKVGLEGLSPGQVALARLLFGAATLLVLSTASRTPLPRRWAELKHLVVIGIFLCVIPFILFGWAEQHISSGLASIYNATTPLMTMAVALLALPSEAKTAGKMIGLVLGFLGVVVILAPWEGLGHNGIAGQLACLGATLCYGIGFTWQRRFVAPLGLPSLSVATGQVCAAAVLSLVLAPLTSRGAMHLTPKVVLAMAALGALGSGLAYVWNANIVRDWGATNASTVTYLTPVVGVVLGVLLLGEHLSWSQPVGALVVILGIAFSQGRITLPGAK